MTDNNTDISRILIQSSTTDVAIGTSATSTFEQKLTSKEIDLDDIFTTKQLMDIFFALENYTQELYLDVFVAINNNN